MPEGLYRELNDILVFVRMPLFTFLSGFIYAFRPYEKNTKRYINGKLKRLLIPMLVIGTIFAIMQHLVPGSNKSIDNWYLLHIVPVAHFWFLEAIFIIFMLMIPFEKYNLLSSKVSFSLIFLMSCVLFILKINVQYFAVTGGIYLLPFFLLGLAAKRFDLLSYLSIKNAWVMFLFVIILFVSVFLGEVIIESKRTLLSLFIGFLSCCILLRAKLESQYLAKIGSFSYSIFLYHVFFAAGSRIVLLKLGVTDINMLFVLSLFAGISGPMVVEKIFAKYKLTSIFLLGKRPPIVKSINQ